MIRAIDAAGNQSEPLTLNYTVAVTPLPVMRSGPTEGSTTRSTAWTWTDNLAGTTYECSMERSDTAAVLESCGSPFTKSGGPADGAYALVIRSTNPGYGTGTTVIDFTLDRTPPVLIVGSGPADGATVTSPTATYAFSSEPGATFECSWSVGVGATSTYHVCTSPVSVPLGFQGKHLVSFRARDAVGNTSAAVTRTVVAALGGTPTITGTPRVGSVLKAAGSWTAGTTLTYRWKRDGHPISGATKATYLLRASDRTHKITVAVTGTKKGFTSKTVITVPVLVGYGHLTSGKARISAPSLRVNHTLSATASPWTPGTTVRYQWYLGTERITGAARSTITLQKSMVGKRLKVTITGTKSGFHTRTVTATSGRVVR